MLTYCPRCGSELPANPNFCPHCGASMGEGQKASEMTITIMWCLTAGYFVARAAGVPTVAIACSLSSFIMGIYLATRKNSTDRIHGWVRIGIGAVIAIVLFIIATGARY